MRKLINPSNCLHKIQVIDKETKTIIKDIYRVVYSEPIGNFCPLFCRYNNDVYHVQSSLDDVSDPFRRNSAYFRYLYIEV